MKIEWLVADVTTVGSPDRAERAILEMMLAGNSPVYVLRELLCDVGTPSRALIT